jgi:hypothetical protein
MNYKLFNFILVCSSVISSSTVLFYIVNKKISDGLTISSTFIIFFLGICKILLSIYSPSTIKGNLLVILILSLVGVEIFFLYLMNYMNKHIK